MFDMDFPAESFDLIWSEGAIYIAGFAAGLSAWRRFLKPGGWLAVSEASWLVPDPPAEPAMFWARNYPGMNSIERNCHIVSEAGYVDADGFVIPVQDWWDNYYGPGESRVAALRTKYAGDPEVLAILEDHQREYDLFRQHCDSYHERHPAGQEQILGGIHFSTLASRADDKDILTDILAAIRARRKAKSLEYHRSPHLLAVQD